MNPQDFKKLWVNKEDSLESFDSSSIKDLQTDSLTKEHLFSGLPKDAAPFLSFGPCHDANLQSVAEQFELEIEFDHFKIIGWNGYGDPIAIDEKNNNIVYLNHDDEFGYVFMNSSIGQMMQFLLIFREFIDLTNAEPIEKHQELFKSAIAKLNTIDPIAIQEGTWEEDLKSFIE